MPATGNTTHLGNKYTHAGTQPLRQAVRQSGRQTGKLKEIPTRKPLHLSKKVIPLLDIDVLPEVSMIIVIACLACDPQIANEHFPAFS